jgi:hypothetical protein
MPVFVLARIQAFWNEWRFEFFPLVQGFQLSTRHFTHSTPNNNHPHITDFITPATASHFMFTLLRRRTQIPGAAAAGGGTTSAAWATPTLRLMMTARRMAATSTTVVTGADGSNSINAFLRPVAEYAATRATAGSAGAVFHSVDAAVEILERTKAAAATAATSTAAGATREFTWCNACDAVLTAAKEYQLLVQTLTRGSTAGGDISTDGDTPKSSPVLRTRAPILVMDGLDAVGKSTAARALADRIPGAVLMRTPNPNFDPARAKFRVLDEPIARAFYCACNYAAALDVVRVAGGLIGGCATHTAEPVLSVSSAANQGPPRTVILDRWWASTCVGGLANRCAPYIHATTTTSTSTGEPVATAANCADAVVEAETFAHLPPRGSPVWQWPSDLPAVDVCAYLTIPESLRRQRMALRGDENAEEVVLRRSARLRAVHLEAYSRVVMPCLSSSPPVGPTEEGTTVVPSGTTASTRGRMHRVEQPTYMYTVNAMLELLLDAEQHSQSGASHGSGATREFFTEGRPALFSEAELATVKPV